MPSLPPDALTLPLTLSVSTMKTVASTAMVSGVNMESKIGVMVAILLASLFAVSFPAISIEIPFLHIPPILFFIGKHFGTGVILATAFIHLLDEAFRSLQNPVIEYRYGKIGKWAGLIILASLLAIFLVEYISTTYVEHLRSKPSAPPTPSTTPLSSRAASPKRCPRAIYLGHSPSRTRPPSVQKHVAIISEHTPLLLAPANGDGMAVTDSSTTAYVPIELPAPPNVKSVSTSSAVSTQAIGLPSSQPNPLVPANLQTHLSHHTHHIHHKLPVVDFIDVLTNSPRICRLGLGPAGEHQHHHHDHMDDDGRSTGRLSRRHSAVRLVDEEHEEEEYHGLRGQTGIHGAPPTIGRKRQIVSILVLQLGIMIHSLVIGLTLAVASGSDFTSLTTAIIFHQLFEGLSLGIRIAALPPAKKKDVLQPLPEDQSRLARGGTSTLEDSSPLNKPSLKMNDHQPEAFSSRSRWAFVQGWNPLREVHWLKPMLSFFFACTTPFGMALGLVVFGSGRARDDASMLLIKGVMSAISAGMLIYAATVEMIAGDFVFGDVEGGHHHHPGHEEDLIGHGLNNDAGHHPDTMDAQQRGRSSQGPTVLHASRPRSPSLTLEGEGDDQSIAVETPTTKKASIAKRVLAVVSLLMGVWMMVVVALGE